MYINQAFHRLFRKIKYVHLNSKKHGFLSKLYTEL